MHCEDAGVRHADQPEAMTITPHESGRIWVSSETVPARKYLVDVNHQGRYYCDCPRHRIYIEPKLAAGKRVNLITHCKHTQAVVWWLGQQTVAALRANNPTELYPT